MFIPRPGQDELMQYDGGRVGILAVPGSGKTHTLSHLAANLISRTDLSDEQEILIVTLVNSAVNNFSTRIASILKSWDLMPGIGYRVRTLHGLAYDIVREMPSLANLENNFIIIGENESQEIIQYHINEWLTRYPDFLYSFSADGDIQRKQQKSWVKDLQKISTSVIKRAKDTQFPISEINNCIHQLQVQDQLINLAVDVYSGYQKSLSIMGAVDFEDLITTAIKVLKENASYRSLLQDRWPFILEDESQDSSLIQQEMISLLSENNHNWVRVGDPNQAIYETFTTADPQLLRDFVNDESTKQVNIPQSGRSSPDIMDIANYLIDWTKYEHPVAQLQCALDHPKIEPTGENDPQPNPSNVVKGIHFHANALKPSEELNIVVRSAGKWIQQHPDGTVVIMVPRNSRGARVAETCLKYDVPFVELLRSSQSTRSVAKTIKTILEFLNNPSSTKKLTAACLAVYENLLPTGETQKTEKEIFQHIKKLNTPEIFFTSGFLDQINIKEFPSVEKTWRILNSWQHAVGLSIDELVLTISSAVYTDPADLALAHKIAIYLKNSLHNALHHDFSDFIQELSTIEKNQTHFLGFSNEDINFNPMRHAGRVVIATIHKAKGLEWDKVYIISANNYNFPSLQENDQYFPERWYVRDGLNLEAEALCQLDILSPANKKDHIEYTQGEATSKARIDFCEERLRLLYVAITRAKQELVITWNTGRNNRFSESLAVSALRKYWEEKNNESDI